MAQALQSVNDDLYIEGKHGKNKGDIIHHNRLTPYQGTHKPKKFIQSKSQLNSSTFANISINQIVLNLKFHPLC